MSCLKIAFPDLGKITPRCTPPLRERRWQWNRYAKISRETKRISFVESHSVKSFCLKLSSHYEVTGNLIALRTIYQQSSEIYAFFYPQLLIGPSLTWISLQIFPTWFLCLMSSMRTILFEFDTTVLEENRKGREEKKGRGREESGEGIEERQSEMELYEAQSGKVQWVELRSLDAEIRSICQPYELH